MALAAHWIFLNLGRVLSHCCFLTRRNLWIFCHRFSVLSIKMAFALCCDRSILGTPMLHRRHLRSHFVQPHSESCRWLTAVPLLVSLLAILLDKNFFISWQPSPTNRAFPFPVVGLRTWNDLPDEVSSAESISSFPLDTKNSPIQYSRNVFSGLFLDWNPFCTVSNGPSSSLYYSGQFRNSRLID